MKMADNDNKVDKYGNNIIEFDWLIVGMALQMSIFDESYPMAPSNNYDWKI